MTDCLQELFEVIKARKQNKEEGSYTCYLFEKGLDKILKKCGEENAEMIIAAKNGEKKQITEETCDLFYHIMVMLIECGVELDEVEAELNKRSEKTGNLKKIKTVNKNS